MTRKLFYLVTILAFQFSFSQMPKGIKPDYEKIKSEIENKKQASYYPKLMKRMKELDTTLTKEDFRNIYYGYTFQKEYEPYAVNNDDQLQAFFEKDTLIESDYKPFIKLANKSLQENPFDLRIMNMLTYVYSLDKNEEMSLKTSFVLNNLIDTIIGSGDGLTCESAFHVISTSHEYTLLSVFGLQSQGQSLIGECDFLRFEKDKYKIPGLYFDVSKLFESMRRKY